MPFPRAKMFLAVCVAVLGGAAEARSAEWVSFQPITGHLLLGFDGRWVESESGGSTDIIEFEERLRLGLKGYSLDPRIFAFGAMIEPTLRQTETDSGTSSFSSDQTNLNYAANFSLLQGVERSPLSLYGNFARNTSEYENDFGNRSDTTTEQRNASLLWKFSPFRSTLNYRELSLDQTFVSGTVQPPIVRDEIHRTLSYQGQSSKMALYLEDDNVDDMTAANEDYETQLARLTNNFRWGKGSNMRSRVEYSNREGTRPEEKTSVDESIRLQHTLNLYSTYDYTYESLKRTQNTETHSGKFGLNHRLYTNLDTSLKLGGLTTQSDQFQEDRYNGDLDFNYRKQIRPALRLQAHLGGGYSHHNIVGGQLDFTESPVVPATGIVVLSQRYILWPTIVVTAPGCNPCLEGPDYLVADAGSDFTQLNIPVGSRIAIGDVITVDYVYQPPSAEYYGIPYRIGFRVDYASFGFYHRTTGEDQTYLSGPDPTAIDDDRTDTTGIEWNWHRGRSRAHASAERIFRKVARRSTTEYQLRQSLAYLLAPSATLNVNFTETFLRNNTDVDTYDSNITVQWFAAPGLSVTPRLSAFRRETDPGGTDSFIKAGVDVLWRWRHLTTDLRYDHTQRDNSGLSRTEDRAIVKLTRKF